MTKFHRSGVRALTAGIAIAVVAAPAALVVGLLPASEPRTDLTPALLASPYRTMILETGANDRVFLDDSGDGAWGSDEPTQGLAGSSRDCTISSDPGETLLTFAGSYVSAKGQPSTSNFASLAAGSIGVAEKRTGVSCAQVGATTSEVLTLGLPTGLRGSFLPLVIESATLDVELKQGARILATAYKGRTAAGARIPVAYFDLAGAGVATERLVTTTLPYLVDRTSCADSADNGPDSAAGDNCAWPIEDPASGSTKAYFDALDLRAVAGDFSLEGGADWGDPATWTHPTAHRSTFELVELADGDLNCAQSLTRSAGTGGTTPQVTLTRLGNADPADPCTRVPYAFSNGTQRAEFLKPLDVDPSAQFVFDFRWTVPADTDWTNDTPTSALLPRTVVDFDSAGTLDGETAIAWCPDLEVVQVAVNGSSTLTPFQVVRNIEAVAQAQDQAVGYPVDDPATTADEDTGQFACLVSQSSTVQDGNPDTVVIQEQVYVYGDIILKKG